MTTHISRVSCLSGRGMLLWTPVLLVTLGLFFPLTGCRSSLPRAPINESPLGETVEAYEALPTPDGDRRPVTPTTVQKDTLSLNDVLRRALLESPRLRSYSLQVRAREADALQAGLYPNPTLSAETEDLPTDAPLSGFSGAEQSVRLALPLEIWSRPWKKRAVATAARDAARWTYERERIEVWTEASQAFAHVLAAQEQLRLAQEQERLASTIYQTVARQVDAGQVSPIERTRANVPLSQSRIAQTHARERLTAAYARLAGTWGATGPVGFQAVRGSFGDVRSIPSLGAIRQHVQQNPMLARRGAEIEQAEARLSLEKANRYPTPNVMAGWQRFGARDAQAFAAGISISLPLFDRNQGATRAARVQVEKAKTQQAAEHVRIDTALTRAYRQLSSSLAEVRTLRNETLPAAESAFNAIRRGYREGKFAYLDVLDAQRTLFDVRSQMIRALRAYYIRRAEVEQLIATPLAEVTDE